MTFNFDNKKLFCLFCWYPMVFKIKISKYSAPNGTQQQFRATIIAIFVASLFDLFGCSHCLSSIILNFEIH